ncbi:enah/Vasp-like a isoform X5 [Periophthalmus magnuspinnatus]|uniref:enah/Vasp-like a isoform X5 n=1 Tax=Periophthalmus magnuspinnatus TaxID=409849 RepID=UPI0024371ABC|nr:enah/Vasp-like a isoform X5 [Periophthalmus magnuspinnatus]
MSEQSICQARASVMIYDDASKKWVPIKPGQQGFSRINIYHNTANNTFRVVGVKLQDQQVVINYSIVKGLKYNQATPTFHQWRDARQVYGLNFASKEEATTFSNAMLFALNVLSSPDSGGPVVQRQNGPSSEENEAQRRMMEQHQMQQAHKERERRTSGSGPPVSAGHPAMLSVAPPTAVPSPAPPPPPGPPPPMAVPPPMPPPLPVGGGPPGGPAGPPQPSGLAAALAGAKLRKVQRDESSPPGSGKADSNRSSGGSGSGGEGLMQEMNALLARRRKASEKPDEDDSSGRGQNSTDAVKKPWERSNSAEKSSLVSRVRPIGSTSESDSEFDRMKQEILDEVVRELHKVKDEIIHAIRQELGRITTS